MSASAPTKSDVRRAELLAAGVRVLRRMGFERMRLRDVAKEAGVSIGLVQHYFETREQLAQHCFAAACGERAHDFAKSALAEGPAWDRISQMIDHAFGAAALHKRAGLWVDLCAAAGRDPTLCREATRVQDVWSDALAEAITDGEASRELALRVGVETVVEALLALVDGAEVAATIGGKNFSPDRLHTAALEIARHLLGVDDAAFASKRPM
jgi:AcrR family transcriptional regulator